MQVRVLVAEVVPLGSRLRNRREELGLSQAQAAKQLDVARKAYRLWEMEASRPAPDRWRSIARWLGISMTALLLAEELIDQQEAGDAQRAAAAAGLTSADWDARSGGELGDYFAQERALIAEQAGAGTLSPSQAASLRHVLSRIQSETDANEGPPWHQGEFRKRFPNNDLAPGLARAALAATAVGVAPDAYEVAELLISELVTNTCTHATSRWVDVAIELGGEALRMTVGDQDPTPITPRPPDAGGGWGLALVGRLATRWGVERARSGKTIWVELDLVELT
jgi:transcriptional regulator with XRE-family HTH domain/anti-sigma regulatory factor (Ser/Thr protein kinase)